MPMLKKGGTIGIFNPSYPITSDSPGAAVRAEKFFNSKGYKIKKGSLWGKSFFYRSGSAKDRASEFNELLYNPEVDCLMASIGGFVSNAMLPYIDYEINNSLPSKFQFIEPIKIEYFLKAVRHFSLPSFFHFPRTNCRTVKVN